MISVVDLPRAWRQKHLTPAEQRVVELVAAGIPTKEAATRLTSPSPLSATSSTGRCAN